MISWLVFFQLIALAAIAWTVARRAQPAPATASRLITIGALLAAQALFHDWIAVGFLPATWREGQGSIPGMVWTTQAVRAAFLLSAFGLWFGISREQVMAGGRRWLLVGALLAQALTGAAFPVLGLAALVWLTSRPTWTLELSGWRRFAVLFFGVILGLLITFWPYVLVREGRLAIQIVVFSDPWQSAPIGGAVPRPLQVELALARPLDRLVQALIDLFRAQLVVLVVRSLTLPLRLYGMSLKRRFMVNYIFVRSIPSTLGFLTLLAVGYFAFGVHKAGQVRSELQKTLVGAETASAALLDDPRIAPGGAAASAGLDSARSWLGPLGDRAHLVLHRARSLGSEARIDSTRGTPPSLLQPGLPAARGRRLHGVIEDGSALYLFTRRTSTLDTSRTLDVFIPMDSVFLTSVADRIGARIGLTLDRGVSSSRVAMSFRADTSGAPIRVSSHGSSDRNAGFFLGRTYLPLGDWGPGWREGIHGAIACELRTTGAQLRGSLADVPGWLFSNVVMVGLLIALTTLIGTIEGLAVRSGKGIVTSIEEEVASLRQAAARFGSGELGHRIPVRGRDELSMLAGSFNEMAANLERQRADLIEKERIEEDLEVARAIQRRFLPQQPPRVPGLTVAGISVPSREVGGDLFHYAALPGDRLAIALGDASGKSVPAALIMSNVMSVLRNEAQHETAIEESLERINRLIVEQVEPGRFVTLFYGIADPASGQLRYANAGHNPVLRISARGDLDWLEEGGVPLGVLPEAEYVSSAVPLESGDTVIVYSDGVTEAEGLGDDGKVALFGEERLAEDGSLPGRCLGRGHRRRRAQGGAPVRRQSPSDRRHHLGRRAPRMTTAAARSPCLDPRSLVSSAFSGPRPATWPRRRARRTSASAIAASPRRSDRAAVESRTRSP